MSLTETLAADEGSDALTTGFSASYAGVMAFIAVAHEGSFSRAADRLGIGRSAVSRSVQKLEGQLGVRLFLRTTRSTSLTREGELFHEGCRPGVDRILQALEEMRDLRDGPPRGHLRISATGGFGRKVIAPLLAPSGRVSQTSPWSCCWKSARWISPPTALTWRSGTACSRTAT